MNNFDLKKKKELAITIALVGIEDTIEFNGIWQFSKWVFNSATFYNN